jgi:glycosyltransferase involved in cell wall biosynthesis
LNTPPPPLTILICTHNRAELLGRVLESINAAHRPADWAVDILVSANACTDKTHALLEDYCRHQDRRGLVPLAWIAEPRPGKSYALNSAIPHISGGWVFLEDDDQRLAPNFLEQVHAIIASQHEFGMICGRLLPDWSGDEPAYIRQDGPYRIYPSPIPDFDLGQKTRALTGDDFLPSGGNLILRTEVFHKVGGFSVELGPRGHNLGGGEDTAFIKAAMGLGEALLYAPSLLQYHYVDPERLKLGFLLRLAYKRTYAVTRLNPPIRFIPKYVWRKLATHLLASTFTLNGDKQRFHWVRTASTLGEIRGFVSRVVEYWRGAGHAKNG